MDFPDYAFFIDLVQRTRIVRLGDDFTLSTGTYSLLDLWPTDQIHSHVINLIDEGTPPVLQIIMAATDLRARNVVPAPRAATIP